MREAGLEPARPESLVSKTNAATNYAIPAYGGVDGTRTRVQKHFRITNLILTSQVSLTFVRSSSLYPDKQSPREGFIYKVIHI